MSFVPRRLQQALKYPSQARRNQMPILMDKILTEYADQAFETARLRRNGVYTTRDLVSAEMLVELEASWRCDAVRKFPRSKLRGRRHHSCATILWTLNSMRRPILRTSNDAQP